MKPPFPLPTKNAIIPPSPHPYLNGCNTMRWNRTDSPCPVPLPRCRGDGATAKPAKIFCRLSSGVPAGMQFEIMPVWWAVRVRGSPAFSGCWRSRTSGSRMTCGSWTMTTCWPYRKAARSLDGIIVEMSEMTPPMPKASRDQELSQQAEGDL